MKNHYTKLMSALAAVILGTPLMQAEGVELTPDDCVNTEAITSTPAGVLHDNLFRSGKGMYCYNGQLLEQMEWDGEIGKIVVDGDKVYVYNPTISGLTYTWMEGYLSDDGKRVIVPTPQLVMGSEAEGWREFLFNVKFDAETAIGVPDTENRDIVYSYEDGVLELIEGMPGLFEWQIPTDPWTWEPIGDKEEWVWSGYADTACRIEPFDYTMATPPADTKLEDYVLYSTQAGVEVCREVKLGINGDEVWISGLEINYPEAFVKGSLKDGVLTFATQFICLDEKANLFQFLLPARAEFAPGEVEASSYSIADKVELKYDSNDGSFTASRDECLFVNGGTVTIYALSLYERPILKKKSDEQTGVPANPVILQYSPYTEEYGFGNFVFALPQTDVNGNYIPTEKLFYVLYDEDEEIVVGPDLFPNVDDYMTEIPYDWWCYDVVPNGCTRTIYMYFTVENPGVRLAYDGYNGEILSSDIVYAITTGVDSIENTKTVVAEEYYDLTGRKVSANTSGIIIKSVRYEDGTLRTCKVINK